MLVGTDPDGGGAVVKAVIDSEVRAQVECRGRQLSHLAPVRRVRSVRLVLAAVVEHALGAVPDLDARAAGAPHDLQALGDVAELFVDDGSGAGDHEVIRDAVYRHTKVWHQVVSPATDLVGDDDPRPAVGQYPGVAGFVEHRSVEIIVFQHGDVGDPGLGEPPFGALDADEHDVVTGLGHRGRNPVRRHSRRAMKPIRPTSSRKAASGAKPST